jgi:hypothetical protein
MTNTTQPAKNQRGASAQAPFEVGAGGQTTLYIDLDVPNTPGDFLLQAQAASGKCPPTLPPLLRLDRQGAFG